MPDMQLCGGTLYCPAAKAGQAVKHRIYTIYPKQLSLF
jgi:hypothetical protein